jgi:hypothetical protein
VIRGTGPTACAGRCWRKTGEDVDAEENERRHGQSPKLSVSAASPVLRRMRTPPAVPAVQRAACGMGRCGAVARKEGAPGVSAGGECPGVSVSRASRFVCCEIGWRRVIRSAGPTACAGGFWRKSGDAERTGGRRQRAAGAFGIVGDIRWAGARRIDRKQGFNTEFHRVHTEFLRGIFYINPSHAGILLRKLGMFLCETLSALGETLCWNLASLAITPGPASRRRSAPAAAWSPASGNPHPQRGLLMPPPQLRGRTHAAPGCRR